MATDLTGVKWWMNAYITDRNAVQAMLDSMEAIAGSSVTVTHTFRTTTYAFSDFILVYTIIPTDTTQFSVVITPSGGSAETVVDSIQDE